MLITGAGGKLGRLLRAAKADMPDLRHTFVFQSRRPGADIRWSPGEETDPLPRCTGLIALWGATDGTAEELSENTRLVRVGCDLARALGATRMIHMSSAAVYGPGQNMDEDYPTENCNPYGKSKLEMEAAVAQERRSWDLEHICLRLANVVGADSLSPALRGDRPARMDDFSTTPSGHQGPRRSYIGARGLLEMLDALLSLPAQSWPTVLNVAMPQPLSMDALITAAGHPITWHPAPETATQEVTLDVSRLQTLLPCRTAHPTAEELVADWLRLESLA